jgi:prepilin-type N-terminal cleavage/methylation domain-containing protein
MLARIRKSMEEKDQGFTLIELLVVMIIIGILAAIAIPVFLNQRKRAVDSSIKSDLRTVANEMETYYTDNQAYNFTTASTAASSTVTLAAGTTVKVSSGNVVAGYPLTTTGTAAADWASATGYCLQGANTKGTGTMITYNSVSGGLATGGAKCPGAP